MLSGMNRLAIILSTCLAVSAAQAQTEAEARYLDDRSSAADVVRSLYNAIGRGEYLRAWSYFDEGGRPDYEKFAEGYAGTAKVRLLVGAESAEGAAGTVYWTVPVAIEAVRDDGTTAVFAGCYQLSQPNPASQATPPFQPIGIREGTLRKVDGPLEDAVPDDCGGD